MPLFRKQQIAKSSQPLVLGVQPGAEGELEARFNALFQKHWARLCRMLYSMTGDWAEAEDLALEAFVQLHRRPPARQENLDGWLYRVAGNLGLNALRSRKRRQHYEEEAIRLEPAQDRDADPASTLERAQEIERVRQALGRMKPRYAQALLLRHSGLSYAEIAAALPASPGSVGVLLVRAEAEFEKQYGRR